MGTEPESDSQSNQHRTVRLAQAVLPFDRFPDVDTLLGPEMKSTGEVMGIDMEFGPAYAKAQLGAGQKLPVSGTVFISVKEKDKATVLPVARRFHRLGFSILATRGTSAYLAKHDVPNMCIHKVSTGRPNVVDAIKNNEIQLVINTGSGSETRRDGYMIRRAAIKFNIPYATTIAGAMAVSKGIAALIEKNLSVKTLQAYHG